MEEHAQEVLGVASIRLPPAEGDVELGRAPIRAVLRPLARLNLGLDADRVKVLLDGFGELAALRVIAAGNRVRVQHDRLAVVAGFFEQRRGLFGVVGIALDIGVEPPGSGRQHTTGRRARSGVELVGQLLFIDGIIHCLTQSLVLILRFVQVELCHVHVQSWLLQNIGVCLALQCWDVLRIDRPRHVRFAVLDLQRAHGRLRHGLEHDALQLGFVAPVAVEGFHRDVVVLLPFDEPERARTNGVLVDALAVLLQGFHRNNEAWRDGQVRQQRRKLAIERELDVEVADGLDFGHDVRDVIGDKWKAAVVALGVLVQRVVFVDLTVERKGSRLGGERRAIVELDARLEVKDVLRAVGRDVPLLGERWLDVGAARLVAHQALVHSCGGDEALLRVHRGWIQAIGVAGEQEGERVGRGRGRFRGWRGRRCGGGRGGCRGSGCRGRGGRWSGRGFSGGWWTGWCGSRRGRPAGGKQAAPGGETRQAEETAATERRRTHL